MDLKKSVKGFGLLFMLLISLISSVCATDVTFNVGIDGVTVTEGETELSVINTTGVINFTDEEHNITLSATNYDSVDLTVNPTTATEYNVTLNETVYTIVINSELDTFEIYDEEGTLIGTFDDASRILELTAGTYNYTAVKTGYENESLNFIVPDTEELNVSMVLLPQDTTDDTTDNTTEDIPVTIIVISDADSRLEQLNDFFRDNLPIICVFGVIFCYGIYRNMKKTNFKPGNKK
ncbi:hypothetical protein [Methanococcus maripaludis]|uniref:PEGA domain-containing protein n=1 Tax=Methanococcus maripaludis TaxID=39152 RepID=A0A7J9PFU3_METMI|nr:hypothetical protein [Methanococcus maripaludis]MBA2861628.1 hypothetical protein [Methanococcus maripaludis]